MQIRKFIVKKKFNFWFFQISGWLIFGVFYFYTKSQMMGPTDISFKHIISWFVDLLTGFAISLLLRQIYKPIYTNSQSIIGFVLISILCSLAGSLMWLSAQDITELVLRIGMPYSIWSMWSESGFYDYLIFNILFRSGPLFAWSFIYYGYKLINDLGIEKNKYQETLLLAKEAQLQMLRYQINPHFLFNTLNSIQALMYKNTPLADEMLAEFSEFLRYTLRNKDEVYVSLEDEIEMISKYLYIEEIRFQDKLNYKIEMSDDTRKIKILSFLLQPFVENAIKYGFQNKQDVLNIDMRAYKHKNWLVITVENSGKWANKNTHKGIGIENVKNRLKNAYFEKHILRIVEENNWVKIKLQLDIINE